MDLKERVKKLCKENNISMNQLEQNLDFGKGYVSKLGKSTPNTTKIQQIANYFGISVDYLMTGKETSDTKERIPSEQEKRYMEYAKRLVELEIDLDKLDAIIEMAEKFQK